MFMGSKLMKIKVKFVFSINNFVLWFKIKVKIYLVIILYKLFLIGRCRFSFKSILLFIIWPKIFG